jgi:hypothetical protein
MEVVAATPQADTLELDTLVVATPQADILEVANLPAGTLAKVTRAGGISAGYTSVLEIVHGESEVEQLVFQIPRAICRPKQGEAQSQSAPGQWCPLSPFHPGLFGFRFCLRPALSTTALSYRPAFDIIVVSLGPLSLFSDFGLFLQRPDPCLFL